MSANKKEVFNSRLSTNLKSLSNHASSVFYTTLENSQFLTNSPLSRYVKTRYYNPSVKNWIKDKLRFLFTWFFHLFLLEDLKAFGRLTVKFVVKIGRGEEGKAFGEIFTNC